MQRILFFSFFLLLFSCDDIIDVVDISNAIVIVLAPSDETVLTNTDVTFSWSEIQDADTYRLQIARPSFEDAQEIVADTSLTGYSFFKILPEGEYQWRIKAENLNYESAFTIQSFTIE